MLVGSPGTRNTDRGAPYLFDLADPVEDSPGVMSENRKLEPSDQIDDVKFGRSVAVEDLPGVVEHDFRFREGPAPIEIRIRPTPDISAKELEPTIRSSIARLLDGFGVVPTEVRVRFASGFDRDPGKMGKHKTLRKESPAGSL